MLKLNNELKQSIKTNELIINITSEEYIKINDIIKNIKSKYQKDLIYVKENNNKNITNMNFHCDLVKKIINDVIQEFDIIEKYNICVFLTGSFARCSNKKNSDIDLQFAYPEQYKNDIFKYEEIIYYIIATILDLNRSSVHSMLISRLYRENINYLERVLDNKELLVTLQSSIGNITYKYKSNTKRRVYLQYGNNNNLENVFKYLKYEIENNNKEWAHVFHVFSQQEQFDSYYSKLYEYEKELLSEERIINRISRIKEKINEIDNHLLTIDKNNISQIKKVYQKKEFALLNEYISYKRDLTLLNNKDWKYINYYENKQYLNKDQIFEYILNYIFTIFELAEPLGVDYSLHTDKYIELGNYEKIEKLIKKINTQIFLNIELMEKEFRSKQKIYCKKKERN